MRLPPERLARAFYARHATEVAPDLLGKVLAVADGRSGRIVEVEAYGGAEDPASHAYRGMTARNAAMFGPPGHLYVYRSYGMHWCANVVTGTAGDGQAVLLRALEPLSGLGPMRAARWSRGQRRQVDDDLCRGPGRLSEALGIDRSHDGADLCAARPAVWVGDDGWPSGAWHVGGQGPRIGITKAADLPWRFWMPGSQAVSGARMKISSA